MWEGYDNDKQFCYDLCKSEPEDYTSVTVKPSDGTCFCNKEMSIQLIQDDDYESAFFDCTGKFFMVYN